MTEVHTSQQNVEHPQLTESGTKRTTSTKHTYRKQEIKASVNEEGTQTPTETAPRTPNDSIIKLIGSKALTHCNLNGLPVRALLDTGAQVSIIDCKWKEQYLPDVEVRPLRTPWV